ncbi:MAG: hypothetical protein IJY36_01985 [Coprobacter sp.]|nr:hypothetical protein [Coprobacter sp.]
MKNIFKRLFGRKRRLPVLAFEIIGCVPMSFGVMFRTKALTDVTIAGDDSVILVNDARRCPTRCINVEKDCTVTTSAVSCSLGDEVSITVAYTDTLMKFPLKGAKIMIE